MDNYQNALIERKKLEDTLSSIEIELKKFNRDDMGVVSSSDERYEEYKTVKSKWDREFKKLQNFNKLFVKTFKNEIRKGRRR